jgi:hypothetical protein
LRDGPSVRGSHKTSRTDSGTLRLLVSARGLATAHTPEVRSPAGHRGAPGGSLQFQNLRFESCLPINLRAFLTAELGQRVCIDDTTIEPASGEFPVAFMRDLARAIRRFSFKRAHESWVETQIDRAELEDRFIGIKNKGSQVLLCLSCAGFAIGTSALGEHRNEPCLSVALQDCANYVCAQDQDSAISELRRALYGEIERFRHARAAMQLPHYDLDYYLRNNQYVFTWRPLPAL